MWEADRKYDPNADAVMFGHCITTPPGESVRGLFPQGGSGFLVSRRAAEVLARALMARVLHNRTMEADDVEMGYLMKRIGFDNASRWATPAMLGTGGGVSMQDVDAKAKLEGMGSCHFFFPANRVAVFHASGAWAWSQKFRDVWSKAPDDVLT